MRTPTQQVNDEESKALRGLCADTALGIKEWWAANRAQYVNKIKEVKS